MIPSEKEKNTGETFAGKSVEKSEMKTNRLFLGRATSPLKPGFASREQLNVFNMDRGLVNQHLPGVKNKSFIWILEHPYNRIATETLEKQLM